ncbi:MAG TPA: hypothetical protein VEY67_06115 [Candidatus Dormibacteraeota bacterium]|nr:hypothetical protein [Candidatus Dormibacteraeota bacterium]
MSTEHFTLQGARSAAISDANGRTSFFLSTLSAAAVALAFIAQLDRAGPSFTVFALIVLPTLLVIGLATFERLLQLGIENIRTVVAINRVRHYYLEVAPELRPHFTLSDRDDQQGVLTSLGSIRGGIRPWDLFVTNAGLVAIIDAIVSGVLAALVAATMGAGAAVAAGGGLIAGGLVLVVLALYLARSWQAAIRSFGVRFSPERTFAETHGLADGPGETR